MCKMLVPIKDEGYNAETMKRRELTNCDVYVVREVGMSNRKGEGGERGKGEEWLSSHAYGQHCGITGPWEKAIFRKGGGVIKGGAGLALRTIQRGHC